MSLCYNFALIIHDSLHDSHYTHLFHSLTRGAMLSHQTGELPWSLICSTPACARRSIFLFIHFTMYLAVIATIARPNKCPQKVGRDVPDVHHNSLGVLVHLILVTQLCDNVFVAGTCWGGRG